MGRFKLIIAYRGTRYHGWQFQPMLPSYKGESPPLGEGIPTIQEALTKAIVSVVHHPVMLCGSSRTDAGVHAKGQLVHLDSDQVQIPTEGMRQAINARLPEDILVRSLESVDDSFDAIRSTVRKRYQYAIWNARDRDPFAADLAWHRWQTLDVDAMKAAAIHLLGEHDFASFAKPGHGRTDTVRTIFDLNVAHRSPRIVIGIEGSGFLWQMIRIIVGTLVEVGLRRYPPDRLIEMLAARDRKAAGPTAPPHGLYLQWIRTSEVLSEPRPSGRVL
ncbi:MAG: tRNA pseudouridine(38-40) synthase TruA [Phycisphaerae bacterium]|nr:tRNA pseudouridine(38-40) synthase TruA [Phycisphaerae bacterium]